MRYRFPTLARIGLAVLALSLAQASGIAIADAGRERLDQFLGAVLSIRSDFEQTLFDEQMNPIEESRGKMFIERPGKFRWEYADPYAQEIVGNGERVWIYDPDLAQVIVRTVGDSPAVLLSTDQPVEDSFVLRELGNQGEVAWIGLQPKSPDATFVDIRLGFGRDTLQFMELVDNFGQLTQVRFINLEQNPRLAPGRFEFTPPEGTDVIEN